MTRHPHARPEEHLARDLVAGALAIGLLLVLFCVLLPLSTVPAP